MVPALGRSDPASFAQPQPGCPCAIGRGLSPSLSVGRRCDRRIRRSRRAAGARASRAEYLVGCDGATSAIRDALGIGSSGEGILGYPVHLFFRAPGLLGAVRQGEPGVFFLAIDRDGLWANIRVVDPANALWRLMMIDSDGKQTPESIDRAALLRRAVGKPFDVEWQGVSVWTRRSVVADRYSRAAFFSPAMRCISFRHWRLGMNTGIGDAVDLGWKLAAVLAGWGGPNCSRPTTASAGRSGCSLGKAAGFHLPHGEFADAFLRSRTIPKPGERCGAASAKFARDVGRHVPHRRAAARLPLRASPIWSPTARRRSPDDPETTCRRRGRAPGAACLARRRPLDARSVRPRLRAAALRRGALGRAEQAAAARRVPLAR